MIHGVRDLRAVPKVAVLPVRPANSLVPSNVPVILLATEAQAKGAEMRVGGLRVVDRAVRLLGRLRDARVIIADDGSIPLPRKLPANTERRAIDAADAPDQLAVLTAELGSETMTVGADCVWLTPGRFDRPIRVVDAASRWSAESVVFGDRSSEPIGIIDRLLNRRIASLLTRLVFSKLPISPALMTLAAGFVGLFGAITIAAGGNNVITGFAILQAFAVLDHCAVELARVRLHQSALAAWLDTIVGDFVNVVLVLAIGVASWRDDGAWMEMKLAMVAGGATLFYMVLSYRELVRQRQGDVMRLRWWFAYGQTLRGMTGAGSRSIRVLLMFGRRDVVILAGLILALCDQLELVLLYCLIVAIARAGGALGQLLTPAWRLRLPA
jgi:hypothetical protein